MSEYPDVSVIVVNLNGRHLLPECLEALLSQDYPQEKLEIIVVDNGSTDDSVAFLRVNYPAVKVIVAGCNLGFAGGNNRGAQAANGYYLALINNDACAAPDWLRTMITALENNADPEVVCVAAKMLDRDGKTIDFVGSVMNLYGRAFQLDEGVPDVSGWYDQPREVLAPCGGAMLIRRDIFWQVGGFDEDYIAYYEDVDLGWRLWLEGYKVLFVPQAIVYHRRHQTGAGFPVEQRYVLSEMNALRTVIKNYDDQNLKSILPLSLFMAVKRALDQAKLDRNSYTFGYPRPEAPQSGVWVSDSMSRVATSFLVAVDQIAEEMPRLMSKRKQIQRARVRSDEEIFARFPLRPDNQIFPWRQYHVIQDQLARDLAVPVVLQPHHGTRLLIISHETLGPKMAGPAIRAWEMACALANSLEVTLAVPGTPTRQHEKLRVVGYDPTDPEYHTLNACINGADVVLAMGPLFAKIPWLRDLNKPAIVDLYDPFELEKLVQSPQVPESEHLILDMDSILSLKLEGALGDFFICANERQRDFWLGTLLAAGRVNTFTYAQDTTLRSLIDVVPFGVPAEPPQRQRPVLKGVHPGIAATDKLLLWNGGLWEWLDPLTLLDALVQVVQVRPDVKLFFAAGYHFNAQTVPEMPVYARTLDRCRTLGLLDRHVFFGDWLPYDERGDYLLEADLAVSIHQPTLESHFASRTRLLDCIWANLPVVCTSGDLLSEQLAARGLAYLVPPDRPDLLAETILSCLANETQRERQVSEFQALQAELSWARAVTPIVTFMQRAAFAPDALVAARQAARARQTEERIRALEAHNARLRTHLEEIKRGRVMRAIRGIQLILGREQEE